MEEKVEPQSTADWKEKFKTKLLKREESERNYFLEGPLHFFSTCLRIDPSTTNLISLEEFDLEPGSKTAAKLANRKSSTHQHIVTKSHVENLIWSDLKDLFPIVLRSLINVLSYNPENKVKMIKMKKRK